MTFQFPVFYFRFFIGCVLCLFFAFSANAQDLTNIKDQKPFQIRGSISAGMGYYQSYGFNTSRKPFMYSIAAAPEISIYGIKIPINFTLIQGSSTIKNPFAQFGINPTWKWIKGYAGWSNIRWSPTTLNGKTFLGIGAEFNPGVFRFGIMYGRFNPAIKENLTGPSPQQPIYKRMGWAFKVGLGKENNFFDFIFLHAKDLSNTIPSPTDTLNYTPAENAVVGINSHQSTKNRKLTWDLDGSISAFSRNTNSQLLDIGTTKGSGFLKSILAPRLSTSYAWSAHTNITYKAETYSLAFDYNRIQPEYQSMGLDYILNDQEKFSFNQTFLASNKKMNVSFMEFFQHDDLNYRKAVKTDRLGINTNFAYNLNQNFGYNFSYNNFFVFQQKGLRELNDTTKLFQLQNTVMFSPRYTFIQQNGIQNILLVMTYSRLDDLNSFTSQYSKNSTLNTNIGYSASITRFALSISPSINILNSKTPLFELFNIGPTLALSKTWMKGKLSTGTSITLTYTRNNGIWNSNTINNNISISYKVNKNHTIKYINNIMHTSLLFSNTCEYKGSLTYTYTFN